jgi:hypothetical protein
MNNTPRTILNGVVVALLAGTILGLVPSLYDATSFLSRSRVFEQDGYVLDSGRPKI